MHPPPDTMQPYFFPVRLNEEPNDNFFLPPTLNEAGLAVTMILNHGLHVSPHAASSTYGFDYSAELLSYGIMEEDWQQFTSIITHETKTSQQQVIAVAAGGSLGRLAVGGVVFGFPAPCPHFLWLREQSSSRTCLIWSLL
ncbi:hypothetical protein N7507_001988 [Penicillium longicatenatum]|nr:hypothetical protein N7507_001988 [Penicillium longicatenatum]